MKKRNKHQVLGIKYQVVSILILMSCYLVPAHAQVAKMPADTEFFYTYGGVNFDEGRDIKETRDKGYIIVGTTSSFGQGNTSVYMIKTDSLGNHKWSSVQGGAENDWGYAVDTTYDGGYFVAGYSNSFYTGTTYDYSAYYFKTDANGNLLWQKYIDNGANSFVYGACAMPDSGFVLCGQTYATTAGTADAYLIRIDKNGNTLWTNHYGDTLDETFKSVCLINNKIYAVGSSGSHAGADSLADGLIVKLDTAGNFIADTYVSFGGRQQITLNGITPYATNLFTICGNDYHLDSSATTAVLIRYDTSFNIVKNITLQNGLQGDTSRGHILQLNKVVNTSHGTIFSIGVKYGGGGGTGVFFLGIDVNGNYINDYSPTDGGTQNDYGYSGILTSGGKVIGIGGTYSSQEYCVNPKMGLEDVFLIRYNSDSIHAQGVVPVYGNCFADSLFLWGAGIKNYNANIVTQLYPNPVSSNAVLKVNGTYTGNCTAKVYSLLGSEVLSIPIILNEDNIINCSSLAAGTYFIQIQSEEGGHISTIKFVVNN